MIVAKTIDADQEKKLLQQWFDTVQFDEESEGIPPLDPEEDDEERSLIPGTEDKVEERKLSDVDMDELMAELRARDPDNPF